MVLNVPQTEWIARKHKDRIDSVVVKVVHVKEKVLGSIPIEVFLLRHEFKNLNHIYEGPYENMTPPT